MCFGDMVAAMWTIARSPYQRTFGVPSVNSDLMEMASPPTATTIHCMIGEATHHEGRGLHTDAVFCEQFSFPSTSFQKDLHLSDYNSDSKLSQQ